MSTALHPGESSAVPLTSSGQGWFDTRTGGRGGQGSCYTKCCTWRHYKQESSVLCVLNYSGLIQSYMCGVSPTASVESSTGSAHYVKQTVLMRHQAPNRTMFISSSWLTGIVNLCPYICIGCKCLSSQLRASQTVTAKVLDHLISQFIHFLLQLLLRSGLGMSGRRGMSGRGGGRGLSLCQHSSGRDSWDGPCYGALL